MVSKANASLDAVRRSVGKSGQGKYEKGLKHAHKLFAKQHPIDKLKFDQSFVKDIALNRSNETIVTAIVLIARSFNLEVIAEGVESAEQVEILRACGCLEVQGYHFCRPISEEDFKRFLESQ